VLEKKKEHQEGVMPCLKKGTKPEVASSGFTQEKREKKSLSREDHNRRKCWLDVTRY